MLFFVAGVVWLTVRAEMVLEDRLPAELEGEILQIKGVIAELPRKTVRGSRFEFLVEAAWREGRAVRAPRRVLLSDYNGAMAPAVGERWLLAVKLKRPHGFQNPGGFDYEGYLFHKRIGARGYIRKDIVPRRLSAAAGQGLGRLRQGLGQRIRHALEGDPFTGVITALANGDRRGISDTQWQVMRRTGTQHLMAISGLHVGLVAGLVFFLARWLWALPGSPVLRWPAPKAAAVCAMAAAVAYAALAGFSLPTQRAMIMLSVVMGAVLLQRRIAPSSLLAAALLLVLLYDPLAVMAAGFWLSFGAVAGILFAMKGQQGRRRWQQWGSIQWAVAVGLAPLSLLFFGQVSVIAPAANLLAVPLFGFIIVPLTLMGVSLLAVAPAAVAALPLQAAVWFVDTLWQVLAWLAGHEQVLWVAPSPPAWALVGATVGAMLVLAPRGWPGRWLGAVWMLPLFVLRPAGPGAGEVWFTLLDVGQGLAAVVRTETHTLVYDTGPRFSDRFDTGQAVVLPYLRSQGVTQVDTLMISHGDNDHIGGAHSVLQAIPVKQVVSSVPQRLSGAAPCQAGRSWHWDGVSFAILNPPVSAWHGGNNASCVLRISGPSGSVLLSGDIEAGGERALLARYGTTLASDILVVPHHGSKTSSTDRFLAAVRPGMALFPVGYRNRYQHPHPSVLARYRRRGIVLYDSPRHGAVQMRLHLRGIAVEPYRDTHRRFWFNR